MHIAPKRWKHTTNSRIIIYNFYEISLAGAEGLEPTTLGFGDRCSTN